MRCNGSVTPWEKFQSAPCALSDSAAASVVKPLLEPGGILTQIMQKVRQFSLGGEAKGLAKLF